MKSLRKGSASPVAKPGCGAAASDVRWAAGVAGGGGTGLATTGLAATEPAAAPALRAGTVLLATSQRLVVACGDGAVELRELQRPGGRRLPAAQFLRGCPIEAGERFVVPGAT